MTHVVKVVVVDDDNGAHYYAEGFGEVGSGRELSPIVFIAVYVVAMGLEKRVPVCAFAQRLLRAGVGWVTRDGMFHLQNEARHLVYELFPVAFEEARNTLVTTNAQYLGVMRSDSHL